MQNKLSVGLVSPGWPLSHFPNGIVTYAQSLLSGLNNQATNVTIFAHDQLETTADNVVNLSKIPPERNILRRLYDPLLYRLSFNYAEYLKLVQNNQDNAKRIAAAIQQRPHPLDILEVEESFGIGDSLTQVLDIPVVTRLHGPWFIIGAIMQQTKHPLYQARVTLEGKAITSSQGVTSPSLDALHQVQQFYNISLPNAVVIPNPTPETSQEEQWSINNINKPSVLFVGRFDRTKGGDIAVQAFQLMAMKNKELEFNFVGPDHQIPVDGKDYDFNAYIQQFVKDPGIRARIKFHGRCSPETVRQLRKNALITIVCSRYETFSISLAESLSSGCPTIASAVGGMKEIIQDGVNGLFACSESPEDFAEKGTSLINDIERMQFLSKNALQYTKDTLSPDAVAKQTIAYYKKILGN